MDVPLGLLILLAVGILWKLDGIDTALQRPPAPGVALHQPLAEALLAPPLPPEPPRWVDTSPRHTLHVRAYRQAVGPESLWHV